MPITTPRAPAHSDDAHHPDCVLGHHEACAVTLSSDAIARSVVRETAPVLTPSAAELSRTVSPRTHRRRRISNIFLMGSRSMAIVEPPSSELVMAGATPTVIVSSVIRAAARSTSATGVPVRPWRVHAPSERAFTMS
jgi:hypothetical protein